MSSCRLIFICISDVYKAISCSKLIVKSHLTKSLVATTHVMQYLTHCGRDKMTDFFTGDNLFSWVKNIFISSIFHLSFFPSVKLPMNRHCTLQWRHNGHDGVSNHQPDDCLLNRSFSRRSKKTSNLRVTGLCAGNSPVTGDFPAQRASNAKNVSIWWRHLGQRISWYPTSDKPLPEPMRRQRTATYMRQRQI